MRNICVFCGSNLGVDSSYSDLAVKLGKKISKENANLIYGGANVGLMRIVAQEVMSNNGHVTGVITHFLSQKHLTLPNLSKLILVETMQERKAKMAELADAFIALPGGMGTLEELSEILTAAQLGFHSKPVGLLNINGYYNHLNKLLDNMVKEKFLLPQHRELVINSDNPDDLFEKMHKFEAPKVGKWIEKIISEN